MLQSEAVHPNDSRSALGEFAEPEPEWFDAEGDLPPTRADVAFKTLSASGDKQASTSQNGSNHTAAKFMDAASSRCLELNAGRALDALLLQDRSSEYTSSSSSQQHSHVLLGHTREQAVQVPVAYTIEQPALPGVHML